MTKTEMAVQSEVMPAPHTAGGESDLSNMVREGMTVQRIENETLLSVSKQHPRNETKIANSALAELILNPNFAHTAYYSIPYKDSRTGRTVPVEGLSIKAAMSLARRWGNCTNAARILSDDETRVIVEGAFIDMETNMRTSRTVSVSKIARYKDYKTGKHTYKPLPPDRLNIAIQAGMSKAVRNAILATLPPYLTSAYFVKAKEVVGSKKGALEAIYKLFEKVGVGANDVANYLKKNCGDMSREERVAQLQGIYNAISDGQYSVQEIFNPVQDAETVEQPKRKSELEKTAEAPSKKRGRKPKATEEATSIEPKNVTFKPSSVTETDNGYTIGTTNKEVYKTSKTEHMQVINVAMDTGNECLAIIDGNEIKNVEVVLE